MDVRSVRALVGSGDALIVVPPFAGLDRPSLAAHTLQACAAREGFQVRVLYLNLALAARIGDHVYEGICFAATSALLGERFFARTAYGVPALGRDHPAIETTINDITGKAEVSPDTIRRLEEGIGDWVEEASDAIMEMGFPIVGFSTTFEQTAASVAFLNRIKERSPSTITLLGGANCEGEMAKGILSLPVRADYVFAGESEETFPAFLRDVAEGRRPESRIVEGRPCKELDRIPLTDFQEFFEQRNAFVPDSVYASNAVAWIPYEGSRGCWWGEKHHCTFCGINGQGMSFRERSASRVIEDLKILHGRHGIARICMTDNIMPRKFFHTLIPRLGEEAPGLHLFYEQKANLTLDHVAALKRAGVKLIQPGIEALSSDLLHRMDKGVTARQNIALLRYARAVGVELSWNLLYGFPGEGRDEYDRTLRLLPLLRHLQPPSDLCRLSIDRFSPYFFAYEKYGIRSIRPMDSYYSALPEGADAERIAYHFMGDYDSGLLAEPELIGAIQAEVDGWKAYWESDGDVPVLAVMELGPDDYFIYDTRELEQTVACRFVHREQAAAALTAHPLTKDTEAGQWAREHRLAVEYEEWHVPLATAPVEVLERFEGGVRAQAPTREAGALPVLPLV